jgi:hypothetical protein
MAIIHGTQVPAVGPSGHDAGCVADPLGERAAIVFATELAADRVPSVRAIRAALHVGQPRAQRLRVYLASVAGRLAGVSPRNSRSDGLSTTCDLERTNASLSGVHLCRDREG